MEMLSDQLGEGSNAAGGGAEEKEKAEEDLEAAFNKPKKKSRWAEPAPILPIKPWQVGENCQALYSGILQENISQNTVTGNSLKTFFIGTLLVYYP